MSSQVRQRVSRINARPSRAFASPFGLSKRELIAAILALLFFFAMVIYYFTSLKPAKQNLALLESKLEVQKQTMLERAQLSAAGEATTKDEAQEALNTLETFRTSYLKPRSQGRIALLNDINALAKKSGVQLTSGIDLTYEQQVENEQEDSANRRRKVEEALNVFPKETVQFSVFGQYPNLRSFIKELEGNKQFIVLDSINLTSTEEAQIGRRSRGAAVGAGIALTIEMSVYFQP